MVIEDGFVSAFKARAYESGEGDQEKIRFLKKRASIDFAGAYTFDAPVNSKRQYMKYKQFARLEERGMHFKLFEEIFIKFSVPENPLVCVTPVVDGDILAGEVD